MVLADTQSSGAPSGSSDAVQLGKRKTGKRSQGSSKAYKQRRKEKKAAFKGQADKGSNLTGLQSRVSQMGQTVMVSTFSIVSDVNVTKTGWQGSPPPAVTQREMIRRWQDGSIQEDIKYFLPLPFHGSG